MKRGFTLIELLVVVLIIGILSAVALPQYEKVVWKSKAVQLRILVKSLAEAQERYYLENSTYAKNIEDLDISFDSLPSKSTHGAAQLIEGSTDPVRGNDEVVIGIGGLGSAVWSFGVFREKGPYSNGASTSTAGYIYWHRNHFSTTAPLREILCYHQGCCQYEPQHASKFCKEVHGIKEEDAVQVWYNNCSYSMPF